MSFVRIEDRMSEGPKFDGIPSAAGWLHVCAMLYASRALTDGFIPAGRVEKLTNDRPEVVHRAVRWLTTARANSEHPLWHEVAGGYQIHDYADAEYGNATRAGAQAARDRAARAGEASALARRQRYGTAQPNSKDRTAPEQPVRGRSEHVVAEQPEHVVGTRSEHVVGTAPEPRPVPSRPSPPLRASHAAPAPARETDPDDQPIEVLARMDLLVEAFDGHDGLLRRPLRGDERPVLMNWAHLERDGTLVPLDEIVQLARRLLATPFRDGLAPATLRAIEPTVQTLARGPAANGAGRVDTPATIQARRLDALADRLEAEGE